MWSATGALIIGVESGSPADKAGVQQGDVIAGSASTDIDDSTTLSARVREASPGDVVKLTIERNGSDEDPHRHPRLHLRHLNPARSDGPELPFSVRPAHQNAETSRVDRAVKR